KNLRNKTLRVLAFALDSASALAIARWAGMTQNRSVLAEMNSPEDATPKGRARQRFPLDPKHPILKHPIDIIQQIGDKMGYQ
ncbi:MAG: hypothetical protein ACKO43_00695, partial [Alphaproteobacteria bacterium]